MLEKVECGCIMNNHKASVLNLSCKIGTNERHPTNTNNQAVYRIVMPLLLPLQTTDCRLFEIRSESRPVNSSEFKPA